MFCRVVIEGGTPETSTNSPQKEVQTSPPDDAESAGETAPDHEGAQAPPPEGSEDARGPIHPRGLLRGDGQLRHGPVGAEAPQSAPGIHVQVVEGRPPFRTPHCRTQTWTTPAHPCDQRNVRVGRFSGPRRETPSFKGKREAGVVQICHRGRHICGPR